MDRRFLFAAGLLFATIIIIAAGRADGGPVCATTYSKGAIVDCGYLNFAQCQAAISGQGGSCDANPFYRNDEKRVPARRSKRHRRS